ncbi:hypothetical protein [uncultured Clostridium sp.]|nr:hypothetical protein [uncultured Clostridium sp.]
MKNDRDKQVEVDIEMNITAEKTAVIFVYFIVNGTYLKNHHLIRRK